MAADTSSSAAATIRVVDGVAAAAAPLIASSIPVKSPDTTPNASVAAITYDDIGGSLSGGATTSGQLDDGTRVRLKRQKIRQMCLSEGLSFEDHCKCRGPG